MRSWRRAEGLSKAPTQNRSSQPLMQTVPPAPSRPLVPAQPPISLLPPPLTFLSFLHCVRQLLPLCPPVCGSLCLERASPASPMTPASGSRPLLQYPLHTATFSGPSTAPLSCSYFPPELQDLASHVRFIICLLVRSSSFPRAGLELLCSAEAGTQGDLNTGV